MFGFFRNKNVPEQGAIQEFDPNGAIPQHIAIIMDGNGRWATKRHLPRIAGHKEGMNTVKKIAIAADELGVKALTLYAFSTENWKRPVEEVSFLMNLPESFFDVFMPEIHERHMRIELLGNIAGLPEATRKIVLKAKEDTKDYEGMVLTFALNYGSRAEIIEATKEIAKQVKDGELTIDQIDEATIDSALQTSFLKEIADPDLLIRTSGELRISNFLCWQIAYSEFFFTTKNWPDFTGELLKEAIAGYQKRHRRFGGL